MPSDLLDHGAIPEVAKSVTAEMMAVLSRLRSEKYIPNGVGIGPDTAQALDQLARLGLVDPGYEGNQRERPYLWLSNWNGTRVLDYQTGVRFSPHYEVSSKTLAQWLEDRGPDRWWGVDGDALLTSQISLPCPADELAQELRKIDQPLLVRARQGDAAAKGQPVEPSVLDTLVAPYGTLLGRPGSPAEDQFLTLCWKRAWHDWLLIEDRQLTAAMAPSPHRDRTRMR
ncbi:MAG: hypothetical protein ACRC33_20115 [Gemmataceae bacterium]